MRRSWAPLHSKRRPFLLRGVRRQATRSQRRDRRPRRPWLRDASPAAGRASSGPGTGGHGRARGTGGDGPRRGRGPSRARHRVPLGTVWQLPPGLRGVRPGGSGPSRRDANRSRRRGRPVRPSVRPGPALRPAARPGAVGTRPTGGGVRPPRGPHALVQLRGPLRPQGAVHPPRREGVGDPALSAPVGRRGEGAGRRGPGGPPGPCRRGPAGAMAGPRRPRSPNPVGGRDSARRSAVSPRPVSGGLRSGPLRPASISSERRRPATSRHRQASPCR